jgi:hypothetical protein
MQPRYLCKTNIDDCKSEVWPNDFRECPRRKDRIRSESGRVLEVVAVTHYMGKSDLNGSPIPCVELELNK